MALFDSMPHECRIQRRVVTLDTLGGTRITRTTLQSNVPCWQQALSTSELLRFDKMGVVVRTKIYFADDPQITDRDEIVITKRNGIVVPTSEEIVYQCLQNSAPDASAGCGVLFRVYGDDTPGAIS
jgi:hypothetical protein